MKINKLKINGFGKLSDKEIELNPKINIVYGKNEAGKSTLLNFIYAMFYGVEKKKEEKYIPWNKETFSGGISYELDDGKSFEVFRDFKKKTPMIYNHNKQDISFSYPIDKKRGIDYLNYQINIDEEAFRNTVIVAQNDIKIDKASQNLMIQKISNIVTSGDENISYLKTIEKINKLQLEQVGTDRTKGKPINIINDNITRYQIAKKKIEEYKTFLEDNEFEIQDVQEKIDTEKLKLSLFRVIKDNNEKKNIKNGEIDIIKNIRDECFNKIDELEEKIDKNGIEKIKKEKKSFKLLTFLFFLLSIISVVLFFMISKVVSYITLGAAVFVLIINIIFKIQFQIEKKKRILEVENIEEKIEQEIAILRNNIKLRQNEIDKKNEDIKEAENEVNRVIMNQFEDKIDSDFIEEAFELDNIELEQKIIEINENINNYKIEQGAKKTRKELMLEDINELPKIQESLERLEEEKKEMLSLNTSFNLAKEGIESAYEIIKNSLSPEFTNQLCEISSKISNGKYQDINFVEPEGLVVKVENGRNIPVESLSQGTIDQMYLGLRLASIDIIFNEKLPVFLDETFAYFDDERLKNILEFLNQSENNRQIIIFTCSNREIEILNRLNIEYHYIDLEN